MPRPWTEDDQQQLDELIAAQKCSLRECAKILGRDHHTIRVHAKLPGDPLRPGPWSDQEKDLLVRLHAAGKDLDYIARRVGRTRKAVETALSRHRKAFRDDPAARTTMQVLAFCFSPERVLRAVRNSGMVAELREYDDQALAQLVSTVRHGW